MEVDTKEFIDENGSEELNAAIKGNHVKKWFFFISLSFTFTATGTFYEACESVKTHFKNSNNAKYGIIKLSKIENIKGN